jgi:hypothetical protein
MPQWTIRTLFLVKERRKNRVRLAKPDDNKIAVTIRTVTRDTKTGKFKYETVETYDVFEATPAEVKEAVIRGLNAAVKK